MPGPGTVTARCPRCLEDITLQVRTEMDPGRDVKVWVTVDIPELERYRHAHCGPHDGGERLPQAA